MPSQSVFLRHPLTQHLPRKMKFSFSACEADCALGMMHDIGAIAIQKNGKFGFKIVAAGGLGLKPHKAITIEEFIEEKDLLPCFEAVIALHSHYSDRTKRARSRVKFLVDKFGEEEFIKNIKKSSHELRRPFPTNPIHKANGKPVKSANLLKVVHLVEFSRKNNLDSVSFQFV